MSDKRTGALNILAHEYMFWLRRLVIRRLESTGNDNPPVEGGAVVVSNHPNGLIDGAIILETAPRLTSVLSKKPLFSTPIVGPILKAMNAMPVVRKQDSVSGDNRALFAEVHRHLSEGGAISVFPEGISHDEPRVMPLKTGAARMALGGPARWIIPAGIFYEKKGAIRTDALVRYGAPIPVLETDSVEGLTDKIRSGLEALVITCDNRELYDAVIRAVNNGLDCSLIDRVFVIESILHRWGSATEAEQGYVLQRLKAIASLRWQQTDVFQAKDLLRVVALGLPALCGWVFSKPLDMVVEWLAIKHSPDPDIVPSSKILGANVFYPVAWLIWIAAIGLSLGAAAGCSVAALIPLGLLSRLYLVNPLRRWRGVFWKSRQAGGAAPWLDEFGWLAQFSPGSSSGLKSDD